jgi:hypothetical protein
MQASASGMALLLSALRQAEEQPAVPAGAGSGARHRTGMPRMGSRGAEASRPKQIVAGRRTLAVWRCRRSYITSWISLNRPVFEVLEGRLRAFSPVLLTQVQTQSILRQAFRRTNGH